MRLLLAQLEAGKISYLVISLEQPLLGSPIYGIVTATAPKLSVVAPVEPWTSTLVTVALPPTTDSTSPSATVSRTAAPTGRDSQTGVLSWLEDFLKRHLENKTVDRAGR